MTWIKTSMQNSSTLDSMNNITMISENIIKNWIRSRRTYWVGVVGKTNDADGTKMVLWMEHSNGVADDSIPHQMTWMEDELWWRPWAVAQSTIQKPNSPSSVVWSQEWTVSETCSPVRQCTPALGMEQAYEGGAAARRQSSNLIRSCFGGSGLVEYTGELTTSHHDRILNN